MRFVVCFLFVATLCAQSLPERDKRYSDIRHPGTVFEMPEYASAAEWNIAADYLRRQILFTSGLDPLPQRNALNPQVFGKISGEGYTIEKVLLETSSGFYLGGNLYRPVGPDGLRPAVLLAHDHDTAGRLGLVVAATNLAQQGHIVFTYDMAGYNDTLQLPHEILGGDSEVLWNRNLLGLQLWNSIRSLDFLTSLHDVDAARISVAGAGSGATQAMLLAAVDERVSAAALVGMASFHQQGSDACENAPGLSIDTHNVELTALIAPRPLLLVSATDDATANTPALEFPAIQHIYELLGRKNNAATVQIDAPHNFNQDSRQAVYAFLSRQTAAPQQSIAEQPVALPQASQLLSLWNRTLPQGTLQNDLALLPMRADAGSHWTRDRLQLALHVASPSPQDLQTETINSWESGEYFALGRISASDRIPGAVLRPRRVREWVKPTLLIHPEGSAWAMSSSESRGGFVAEILSRGGAVMAVDLFETGRARVPRDIADAGPQAAAFFTAFNRTDTSQRVQDILTSVAYARQLFATDDIQLICPDAAGLWCGLAAAFLDAPLDLAIDWQTFDAGNDDAYIQTLFVPGIRKAGGLIAAVALWTTGRTIVYNSGAHFPGAASLALNTPFDWEALLEWAAPRRRPGE